MLSENRLIITPQDYALLTDLYELTMAACYTGEGIADKPASFELFTRQLPENFGYLIAMGLEQVIEYLENLQFTSQHIEALQKTGIFDHVPAQFWSLLESRGFTGDVYAVPEGTAIFTNEPMVRIEAPLWQAQIVETYILNTINYQTAIATRAARIRDVAGKQAKLLEFGTRRAFSPQGAIWASRAALAAGFDSTSNVLAALQLGQKPMGTMAHALVMAFKPLSGSEDDAFDAFGRYFPSATLLIDTYDTVDTAERLSKQVQAGTRSVTGVRLDSGDLATLSQKVRSLLPQIEIFASGDLDEWEIARLQDANASIDGYGVGTKLVSGNPVNGVYKLVEIDGIPTKKKSSSKETYPGRKQIFRTMNNNLINQDRLGLATENAQPGEQGLLQLFMKQGQRVYAPETMDIIRKRTANSVSSLPSEIRELNPTQPIKPLISKKLSSINW